MLSTREIKERIRGVTNIQKITRAMEMVAASRLRRAEARVVASRPYNEKITGLLNYLATTTVGQTHHLLKPRDIKVIKVLLITSDKGLCGSYNTNIIQHAVRFVRQNSDKDVRLTLIGKKGKTFFCGRRFNIETNVPHDVEKIGEEQIKELASQFIADYEAGTCDQVQIFFTRFVTIMRGVPTSLKLLPVETEADEETKRVASMTDYIFEPSAEELFSGLFPKYVESAIRCAIYEALAAEFAARRVAMISASENAAEMIDELTRSFNRARQEAITKELLEIVSGAEALTTR
ncbi:MAG: ATP synthase F1 subunit gamma [Planctomycetota bacterium]|jgi:F-type H+-transporting ATPase subunit gamma